LVGDKVENASFSVVNGATGEEEKLEDLSEKILNLLQYVFTATHYGTDFKGTTILKNLERY
jgi:hypothetical protein